MCLRRKMLLSFQPQQKRREMAMAEETGIGLLLAVNIIAGLAMAYGFWCIGRECLEDWKLKREEREFIAEFKASPHWFQQVMVDLLEQRDEEARVYWKERFAIT